MRTLKIVSALLCAVILLSFAACTDNTADNSENVVLSEVLSDINTKISLSADDMRTIEDKDALELYYSIAPEDVKQFAGETAKNSSEDITEIVLVEAADDAAADRVYEALVKRYEAQKNLCASYSAELLSVINNCKVERSGSFVTLVLSDDYASVMEVYASHF